MLRSAVHSLVGFQRQIVKALLAGQLPDTVPADCAAGLIEGHVVRIVAVVHPAQPGIVPAGAGVVQQLDGTLQEPLVLCYRVKRQKLHCIPSAVVRRPVELTAGIGQLLLGKILTVEGRLGLDIGQIAVVPGRAPEIVHGKEQLPRLPARTARVARRVIGKAVPCADKMSGLCIARPEMLKHILNRQRRQLAEVRRILGIGGFQQLLHSVVRQRRGLKASIRRHRATATEQAECHCRGQQAA